MNLPQDSDGPLDRLVPPLVYLFFILFFIGWLLPRLWIGFVSLWLRLLLGRSPVAQRLIRREIEQFKLWINQYKEDDGAAHPLAVLMSIRSHFIELLRMRAALKGDEDRKARSDVRGNHRQSDRRVESWYIIRDTQRLHQDHQRF